MRRISLILGVIFIGFFTSCSKKDNAADPSIIVSPDSLKVTADGEESILDVRMNGSKWVVTSDQSWCTLIIQSSILTYVQVMVTSDANTTKNERIAKLTFVMDAKTTVNVTVVQEGQKILYPDYSSRIAPDASGMGSNIGRAL